MRKVSVFLLALHLTLTPPPVFAASPYIHYQEPEFLTFDELKSLVDNPEPGGPLGEKLKKFWVTPIISNEAWDAGAKPRALVSQELGPVLRVASWNIEKSFRIREAVKLLTDPAAFYPMMDPERVEERSALFRDLLRQRERLMTADILLLQEMDLGVKRSGYVHAAAELAKALNMNYAYGAQQLEIDPVLLGIEKIQYEGGGVDKEMTDYFVVDPKLYKGVFGSAVLSRYPIKQVEVFQLRHKAYDWYSGEKPKIGFVEKTRRAGTKVLFKNILTREMKVGGRIYFRVDLDVPELPGKTLTIINIHLEIKCQPRERELQIAEILSYIKGIRNPVILMGDFNSAPSDLSPTSAFRILKNTAKDPTTWLGAAVSYFSPYGLPFNATRGVSNVTKNFQNPLAKNIPVLGPNPVYGLFKKIEKFQFEDGGVFDFRGDKKRSRGRKSKKLANSNQRDRKGFKTTFQVRRPIGPVLGKYRLDWVFVKSYLKDPRFGPYRFAPHFGETLEELNTSMRIPVSDHHPNVVDLPFREPKLEEAGK